MVSGGSMATKKIKAAKKAPRPARKAVTVKKGVPRARRPMLPQIDIRPHQLVPTHEKVAEKERTAILERLFASLKEVPRISIKDPGIRHLEPKLGDLIRISRKSPTAGRTVYYRVVSQGTVSNV